MRDKARGSFVAQWRVLAAALFLVVLGCSTPKPVPSYECITQYDRMTNQYEPLLSLVYSPKPLDLKAYRGVIVGPVTLGTTWVESADDATHYATYYRVCLLKDLLGLNKFRKVSFAGGADDWGGSLDGVLRIDTMFTRFYMGSGVMRYLSYFMFYLQGSATDLQIEGRITDAATGQTVAEFADRRRDLGNTPWGPNPHNFRRGFAMAVTAHKTAQAFADFMDEARDDDKPGGSTAKPDAGRRIALEGSK